MASPSRAPRAAVTWRISSDRNLAIGERQPSGSTTAQARPSALSDCARSVRASKRLRGHSPPGLDRAHHSARLDRAREDLEARSAEHAGEVLYLHAQPAVGAIGAVAKQQVVVRHALYRQPHLDAAEGEHLLEQAVDQLVHVLLLDEPHLEVELRELGLAVGPKSSSRKQRAIW